MSKAAESDLYPPIKAYLEGQGYEVKAEIGACDVMARRGEEPPLIVEMKLSFSLALVLQGVARLSVADHVYLAVLGKAGWKQRPKEVLGLCRRLGLGLLAVELDPPRVVAHLDPGPYQPRKNAKRAGRLLKEFEERVGDPNLGGLGGVKKVTAYRQNALRCARELAGGRQKASDVASATGVAVAARLMRDDHYGWFERVERGIYQLTPRGEEALEAYAGILRELA